MLRAASTDERHYKSGTTAAAAALTVCPPVVATHMPMKCALKRSMRHSLSLNCRPLILTEAPRSDTLLWHSALGACWDGPPRPKAVMAAAQMLPLLPNDRSGIGSPRGIATATAQQPRWGPRCVRLLLLILICLHAASSEGHMPQHPSISE